MNVELSVPRGENLGSFFHSNSDHFLSYNIMHFNNTLHIQVFSLSAEKYKRLVLQVKREEVGMHDLTMSVYCHLLSPSLNTES